MSDKPILMSPAMVRAILREIEQPGTGKTQTRRIWTLPKAHTWADEAAGLLTYAGNGLTYAVDELRCPYSVGDRLYVREAWHAARSLDSTPPRDIPRDADIEHAATARSYAEIGLKGKLRPAMFLPRWASRITLIVNDVRVQRLQEISEADAKAEGVERVEYDGDHPQYVGHYGFRDYRDHPHAVVPFIMAQSSFRTLWDSINGDRPGYGWDANPWVAAYTFRPILGNIDQIGGDA